MLNCCWVIEIPRTSLLLSVVYRLRRPKIIIFKVAIHTLLLSIIQCSLLLTFFYRYMPDLINRGYVYIAQPPLYGLKKKNSASGKILKYIYNDEAKDELVAKLENPDKYEMQRYKGLGEMDPQQLWETTMEPETRTLLQVDIEDAAAAELAVSELMGELVEPRKEFIQKHARDVRFLDI